jgi:Crp-like helix-turn-helix domain
MLLLANFGKESAPAPIVGKFSQELLAEMIGTTRSRVSHFMNKFRQLGYIKYNGNLEIHNSLLNVVLYDKPEIRQERSSLGGEGRWPACRASTKFEFAINLKTAKALGLTVIE